MNMLTVPYPLKYHLVWLYPFLRTQQKVSSFLSFLKFFLQTSTDKEANKLME